MQKDQQLEEDEVLFKAINKEETYIKAEDKASVNFAITRSNTKPLGRADSGKQKFVKLPKCKKYGCKYLTNQAFKYTNKECDKYHKKRHISHFYDSYTFLYKMQLSLEANELY